MNIKCFFIVYVMCFEFVEMKSECSEHFKCFSDFLKEFIETDLKYDIIIKEKKKYDEDQLDTPVITFQIPSYKLINIVKQVINLFDLYYEGYSEIKHKIEEGLSIVNSEDVTLKKQVTSVVDGKNKQFEGESSIEDNIKNKLHSKTEDVKRNEVVIDEFDDYYDLEHDNVTDYPIIDYIELYKDTTNELAQVSVTEISEIEEFHKTTSYEEHSLNKGESSNIQQQCYFNGTSNDVTRSVFPWIVALFVKNGSSDQFDYYCDGALLSDRTILTAARCVSRNNTVIQADDIIILLGKRSLQTMGDKERAVKITEINLHDNFTSVYEESNDLAILRIQEPVSFNDAVQPACLSTSDDTEEFIQDGVEIYTTGWAVSGELTPIRLDKEKSKLCQKDVTSDDTFCANYNNDVTTCPSYGGLYIAKGADEIWRIRGVRTGDPTQKGFCINTGVFYTDLLRHTYWIQNNV